MFITGPYTRYTRPALWGFFICIALAGILAVVRLFVPSYETHRWNSERITRCTQTEKVIQNAFQNCINQLTRIVEHVSKDTSLIAGLRVNDISGAIKAFKALLSYQIYDEQTLDLIDSQGTILAWNGPSITSKYSEILGQNPTQRFIRVTQHGLRTYLSYGITLIDGKFFLIASEPLELNSPISNRFVQKVSLSDNLSQELETKITLRLPQTYSLNQGEFLVPINDSEGKTIAEFTVTERSLENLTISIVEVCETYMALCIAFGSLFLACAITLWMSNKQRGWVSIIACILFLWLVRLIWRALEFPAGLIDGWLFNPNLYASSFAFGLSSSLGDLILTSVTAVISARLFFVGIFRKIQTDKILSKLGARTGSIGTIIFVFLITLLTLWLFRGFGEALRSFVFDSTIRYNNPSEILLDGTAVLMHANILLLGISLLYLSTSLLGIGKKLLSIRFPTSEWRAKIIFVFLLLFGIPFFAVLDNTPQIPILYSIIFIAFSAILVELLFRWNKSGTDLTSQKYWILAWMIAGSFLIGTPLLHQKLQQKEYRDIESAASDFLRPSDSWLMYVVLDGLHMSAENLENELTRIRLNTIKETNLAFVLWTKTLLGKEGYNSALVLYDDQGNEADRFVVGMTKQEQREILTRTFDGEEDAIHIAGQTEPKTLGKLYGAWITVRNSSGQLAGSIALLLSERQKTIFHEEEIEPLRQFGDRLENNATREIAMHEFHANTLTFSTGRKLFPEQIIDPETANELHKIHTGVLWKDLVINGYKTQTMFMKDSASPEKVVAISLEKLDFRWDLFNYLKEFIIYLAALSAVGLYVLIHRGGRGILPEIGFKGKLFLGFAFITLSLLAVLSYYNRQLVSERVQEQLATTLYRELIQLQDRISVYVSDEEDFLHGVDDDFCEALAAEYGIDFSIYRRASIQASSRPELYRAALLDGRLNGEAYFSTLLVGKSSLLSKEKIGSVEYVVGYAPLSIAGKTVGVLAIPTLNRQKEIESEVAQRNAYVFGAYAIVFGIALAAGGFLALRFSQPLHQLTLAAKDVSEGNLDVNVDVRSRDETGTLARSFNEMVAKLRSSRIELAKHEREKAWKEMAKQVAHEIRNPLTPIKLSIQHVRQAYKDKAPDREEILQRVTQTVIEQIEALTRIASEFSRFAKMPESKFERLNIDALLRETMDLFREVQDVGFIDRCACPAVMVVADRDQLRGVFINIIRNAIQAFNKNGTITVETSLDGHICIMKISDTGSGIPDEVRTKIFEPNFSTKTEGMGLGLAIARRVIEDHGGTIACLSERGKGTTFEIRLPV